MNQSPLPPGEYPCPSESSAFWVLFFLAFSFLFVVAVAASSVGMNWRSLLPGAEDSKGFVEGVSSAVYTFMSHIT